MAHQSIRLPPDSTGKRVFNRVMTNLDFDNGTIDFAVGDIIVGATSGVIGDITQVEGTTAVGEVHVLLNENSVVGFIDGEDLDVNSITNATADGVGTHYYVPIQMLVGGSTTAHYAEVDEYGSIQTKFTEGSPGLDAFGNLEVSEQTSIAQYVYRYDKLPYLISEAISGSAQGLFTDGDQHWVNMQVTNSAGDAIIRTTDMYHMFQPGFATVARSAFWHGDTGKTNNRRRWGYFDERNGIFFELDGTTLNVVVRSSATGSIVETKIAQADWNLDTMDGDADRNNKSGVNLDITKTQIYTFELAQPGDIFRFGVQYAGKHLIVHEHQHGNVSSYPMLAHFNLPMRWENVNTAATAGTSNMYHIVATVKVSGPFEPEGITVARDSSLVTVTTSAGWTPIFSGRSKTLFNGEDNRKIIAPTNFNIINTGSKAIEVALIYDGTLTGATWTDDPGAFSSAIQDTTATEVSGGIPLQQLFVKADDVENIILTTKMATPEGKLVSRADVNDTPYHMTVAARLLEGSSGSTTVKAVMNWREF